jgi:beta-1,4-mannooligosaccharide/beta-1,4-mannosyl-N-acetylglucosamine phosphorylase
LDEESGEIRVYYGGADTCLALATAQLSDLLGYLRNCPQSALPISGKATITSTIT